MTAIKRSRKIFRRLEAYIIYRMASSLVRQSPALGSAGQGGGGASGLGTHTHTAGQRCRGRPHRTCRRVKDASRPSTDRTMQIILGFFVIAIIVLKLEFPTFALVSSQRARSRTPAAPL